MASRLELQTLLESILGSAAVYFQPPETVQLVYPCLIYKRSEIRSDYADNAVYKKKKEYTITVIDRDPDSIIPDKIASIPTAKFSTYFPADQLHHDVFTIFY